MIPFKRLLLGFTLIELLIVVAIIAILAAIAVPNFLEAQVRAKVARCMSDMRTTALALEAYTVDYNVAPVDSLFAAMSVSINPASGSETIATAENRFWISNSPSATERRLWNGDYWNPTGKSWASLSTTEQLSLKMLFWQNTVAGVNSKVLFFWEWALTTPVGYISRQTSDAFRQDYWITGTGAPDIYQYQSSGSNPSFNGLDKYRSFTYRNYQHFDTMWRQVNGDSSDPSSASYPRRNSGGASYSGNCWVYRAGGYRWALVSAGPSSRGNMKQISCYSMWESPWIGQVSFPGYDPTNGTKSWGYLVRTNKGAYTIGSVPDLPDYNWSTDKSGIPGYGKKGNAGIP